MSCHVFRRAERPSGVHRANSPELLRAALGGAPPRGRASSRRTAGAGVAAEERGAAGEHRELGLVGGAPRQAELLGLALGDERPDAAAEPRAECRGALGAEPAGEAGERARLGNLVAEPLLGEVLRLVDQRPEGREVAGRERPGGARHQPLRLGDEVIEPVAQHLRGHRARRRLVDEGAQPLRRLRSLVEQRAERHRHLAGPRPPQPEQRLERLDRLVVALAVLAGLRRGDAAGADDEHAIAERHRRPRAAPARSDSRRRGPARRTGSRCDPGCRRACRRRDRRRDRRTRRRSRSRRDRRRAPRGWRCDRPSRGARRGHCDRRWPGTPR